MVLLSISFSFDVQAGARAVRVLEVVDMVGWC